jgi:hypothetical protein
MLNGKMIVNNNQEHMESIMPELEVVSQHLPRVTKRMYKKYQNSWVSQPRSAQGTS